LEVERFMAMRVSGLTLFLLLTFLPIAPVLSLQ
jgi:hypothetical protein